MVENFKYDSFRKAGGGGGRGTQKKVNEYKANDKMKSL